VSVAVVTLTRFPDIFDRLRASVDRWEPRWEPGALKIVVTSGGAEVSAPGWTVVKGEEPFVFARNANAGILAAEARDVLLVNDDCELDYDVTRPLSWVVEHSPMLGVLSPQINGGVGNRLQRYGARPSSYSPELGYYSSREHLSFVCVYIPARTVALVGMMDERYTGYGADDRDYCRRVQDAGLELGVTPRCVVRHGFGGRVASASFLRIMTRAEQDASKRLMHEEFEKKFGVQ
jgi:GT2 family glycosyltransferase